MSQPAARGHAKVTQKELNEKFDNLKTLLKNVKNKNKEGKEVAGDLYTHLQDVFKILILHYPDNALEKLEEVSFLIKHKDKFDMENYLKMSDLRNYKEVCKQMESYNAQMKTQFGAQKPVGDDDDGGEVAEPDPVGEVPDLLQESYVFQWAGVGFGQQEMYRLQKSLKKLAADSGASFLRFFGMIRGTQKDYYIAEGEVAEGDDDGGPERPPEFEAKGTGVNKFTYWVSHSSFGAWFKLPDLLPGDIRASRTIKVLFTGDLERTIYTNPYFFGKEKDYLRAQIARITHSTTLIPKGLWKLNEESKREIAEVTPEDDTELVLPTTNQMNNVEMWQHYKEGILMNCRTTHQEPTDLADDADPEAEMAKIEKADPYEDRLKSITADKQVVVSKNQKIPPWVVRLMGDATEYKTEAGKTVSNGVVVVRSLQWPGSYNFYYQGRTIQIYVGNGHKYEEVSYFPVHPPAVLGDPDEYELQPEPTPLTEPPAKAEVKGDDDENGDGD